MISSFAASVYYFVWDQLAFRGYWLLPAMLALTLAGLWWAWRGADGRHRLLKRSALGLLAALVLLEVWGLRLVWEPDFADYASELRRAKSYIGKPVPELQFRRFEDNAPLRLSVFAIGWFCSISGRPGARRAFARCRRWPICNGLTASGDWWSLRCRTSRGSGWSLFCRTTRSTL